ncbi:TIGR03809 family protein [Rhodopseudomonas sp. P2A-2r]|uniref:TIGR03809 family protein n=1 Tax=unclassified Rhodopseudomonas TaxID=2638247 RepID=UPI002234E67E|nr:TIGR03809 family protein [Rhodopseudomonas sp. P2A-2r]UZE47676.1 TIGR03809 family protein [Rhodopseudomonas sp. P2A-2r]
MTQRHAPVHGREIIERWRALAERRLDYLTDLFESGRWRRFHSEADFLDNIREAKAAVETWRGLATAEAARNTPSWLDRLGSTPAYHGTVLYEEPRPRALQPSELRNVPLVARAPSPPLQPDAIASAVEPTREAQIALAPLARATVADQASESEADWQKLLEPLVLLERYPILRNAI